MEALARGGGGGRQPGSNYAWMCVSKSEGIVHFSASRE